MYLRSCGISLYEPFYYGFKKQHFKNADIYTVSIIESLHLNFDWYILLLLDS